MRDIHTHGQKQHGIDTDTYTHMNIHIVDISPIAAACVDIYVEEGRDRQTDRQTEAILFSFSSHKRK